MSWLILGAGYIGERVADLAHAQGESVFCVSSNALSAAQLQARKPYLAFSADVTDLSSVQALRRALPSLPTQILHSASSGRGGAPAYQRVFVEGIRHLLEVFPESALAFTSSSSVYGQVTGETVDENAETLPITETSRLLLEAESLVLEAHGLVGRLAGIYGPHRSHPLKQFLSQKASIEGNGSHGKYLNQIHQEDAAAGLVHLMKAAHRGIFNISDDCPLLQHDFFEGLAQRFSLPMPPVSEVVTQRKRAWTHKKVSNARLLATGFRCQYPSFFEALDHDTAFLPSILGQLESDT